jgi:alkyl hydroperoxide reductase subunit AhpF
MPLLDERTRELVRQRLAALPAPVELLHFTQSLACDSCPQARRLLEELAGLSDNVRLSIHNLQVDRELAQAHAVERVPATVLRGPGAASLVYYGVPAGYEFGALLEALAMVASGDSGLEETTRARLAAVREPLHLQVFVTPT